VGAAIPQVVAHLRGGGLLAYPTETVYGLGSRAMQPDVAALAALKGRAASKPFLLLISDRAMAEANGLAFNASADALARAFWPGPLTLVLPGGSGRLPDLLRGPDGGIAVRWTSHQAIARLVAALGGPLTSAVAAGKLLVLDGGVLGNRPPSTVVDCTKPRAQIVREGTLSVHELRRAVGRLAP